ncbi:hypothetical protein [Bacillus ndiopicus]|uniref:hypothetical protein n=1 Tax=Bacillus ndiopicus TaxID=1347368 RepID=UPI0005AA4B10|nr:hypothetical protein [Bacillus ndiopicus]
MELTAIVGVLSALIGMALTYLAFMRNRDKDVQRSAAESAVISTKLDSINVGVENIRIDMKVEQRERMELSERVTRVEESSKSAHLRINKLEGLMDEN